VPAVDFVAFDLETTGLSPKSDRIIEIAAVRFGADLRVVDRIDLIVDPGMPVPLAVQRLTGLTDADVCGAPSGIEGAAQLADFCDGARLVAHGAAFDLAFCAGLVPEAFARRPVLDTLELARILLPVARSHSLPLLCADLGIEHLRPHRADSDAEATRLLFTRLVEVAEGLPAGLLAAIRRLVAGIRGPLREFFAAVVTGDGDPGAPWAGGAARRRGPVPAAPATPDLSHGPLAEVAAALLGPGGPLAAGPGYEYRESQVQMARAVAQTLERSGRLLVEAGTGTGKSLAYLLPLALWTRRTGGRAVVATHTIALQEQLADRELPVVSALTGSRVESAVLKGRQHYLSLRRWERFLAGPDHGAQGPELEVLRFKLKLLCWLAQTETGDRGELRLAGSEEALWERVQSETGDCLGSVCANWRDGRCFMVAARQAAADADLVVTNHALLLADAERQGQVLTPYAALVVDEAHRLEEAATRQLGCELRAAAVVAVLDRLRAHEDGELATALAGAREATQRLFGDAKGFVATSLGLDHPGNASIALTEAARAAPCFAPLGRSGLHARSRLREAAAALRQARGAGAVEAELLPQPDRADDELELAAASLEEAALAVDRVLCAPRPESVCWVELRAEQAELREAPLNVAGRLAADVLDRVDAAVLTSATLSVAGTLDFARHRTGLGERAEELILPSPFDFLSQALCVLATDVPGHDDPGHAVALAELAGGIASRLHGRTMVLFTGYAPLRSVHALLTPRLEAQGIATLGQGLDGTRRQVLTSFVGNPRSVLLGTTSFWEGIDIPGDALSCVVIAKLPFPVPSDPLVAARGALLRDPFGELALPTAVLRLRQGFGRLIRAGSDRGAVVLCDARLDSRDYGQTFLRALPEALVVREPAAGVPRIVDDFVAAGIVPDAARRIDREGDPAGARPGCDDAA
jgi:Rad3-related DNA helicase/DNA polymerase III epsilon subunit-like protein